MFRCRARKGAILILALWVLLFLTVLAVQIGLTVRQRISLISRIETRQHLRDAGTSGVLKAISALRLDLARNGGLYTNYGKAYRHNNRETFKDIKVGPAIAHVQYTYEPTADAEPQTRYGFVDEESKINVNTADYKTLERLFGHVLSLSEEKAQQLALAVLDWREYGDTLPKGFNSDEYYSNLRFPYPKKKAEFEVVDELGLVEGFTPERLKRLRPFVTVYGDGLVNINTAPKEVLLALGLDGALADKVLQVRQGPDGEEATPDDYIFYKTFDIATEIRSLLKLSAPEVEQIDILNRTGKIKTNSAFFDIESLATLEHRKETLWTSCIYNAGDEKIEFWREK